VVSVRGVWNELASAGMGRVLRFGLSVPSASRPIVNAPLDISYCL
jgi:hypothetical protein